MVSKFEIDLNQCEFSALFLCLARICFCQIITIGLLELPGQIGSSNLFVCQVEQMHLVWRFWEGLASPCYCFQLLLVNISKFKRCHDANMHAKSGKNIRIFQYQTGAVTDPQNAYHHYWKRWKDQDLQQSSLQLQVDQNLRPEAPDSPVKMAGVSGHLDRRFRRARVSGATVRRLRSTSSRREFCSRSGSFHLFQ